MFEYESCYIGYKIEYNNDLYYVYDDDEKYLYMYKAIPNINNHFGIKNEGLRYLFDFDNPVRIDKHHSFYNVRNNFFGIESDKLDKLKEKMLSSSLNEEVNQTSTNKEFELGTVLTLKKSNHKIVYLWKDKSMIYHTQIRGGYFLNRICKINESKIKKAYDKLNEDEIKQLLMNIYMDLLSKDYVDAGKDLKEKVSSCLKIYS